MHLTSTDQIWAAQVNSYAWSEYSSLIHYILYLGTSQDNMEAPQMYTSMEVEYDSDEDLQDVGNELTTWLAQLNADSASGKVGALVSCPQ